MKRFLIGVTVAITIAVIGPVWAQAPPPGARLPGVPATYPAPDEWDAIALTFAEPVKEPRQRAIEPSGDPSRAWLAI